MHAPTLMQLTMSSKEQALIRQGGFDLSGYEEARESLRLKGMVETNDQGRTVLTRKGYDMWKDAR